jgi:hypothetical protein
MPSTDRRQGRDHHDGLEGRMTDSLETRVLRAMTVGLDSVLGIRISLNADETAVAAVLAELVATGLVRVDEGGETYVLTEAGVERAAASLLVEPVKSGRSWLRRRQS